MVKRTSIGTKKAGVQRCETAKRIEARDLAEVGVWVVGHDCEVVWCPVQDMHKTCRAHARWANSSTKEAGGSLGIAGGRSRSGSATEKVKRKVGVANASSCITATADHASPAKKMKRREALDGHV